MRKGTNPFEQENIRTLAVPIFVNKSSYPGVAAPFTREIVKVLSRYTGLTLTSSVGGSEDAVLIGIVDSPSRYNQAYKTAATKFTSGELKDSIGNRAQFYLPTASIFSIGVRLILIKRPTKVELELLASDFGNLVKATATPEDVTGGNQDLVVNKTENRMIFQEVFNYTSGFNRETQDTIVPDSGGTVNYVKTKRYFNQTIESLAIQMGRDFEDLVLNVF